MAKRLEDRPDDWRDIGGNPDSWDKQNLTNLINKFKRRKFILEGHVITGATYIKMVMAEARHAHGMDSPTARHNKFALKSKDSDMRVLTAIPPELNKEIEAAYPTMFRHKDHSIWFAKNFPEFRVALNV